MWNYTIYYIKHNPISLEAFEMMISQIQTIQLDFHNGYILFEASDYLYNDITEHYDWIFHPLRASPNLINQTHIKPHTIQDIVNYTNIRCTTIQFKSDYQYDNIYHELFDYTHIIHFIDYSQIITDLEQLGIVQTQPSTNQLATDKRRFQLRDINMEVDCLGLSAFNKLSQLMENMWIKRNLITPSILDNTYNIFIQQHSEYLN